MNSNGSLNVILKKIQENAHLFENNKDITYLASVVCKLGNLIIRKSLSCSLLKNVLIALKLLNDNYVINDDEYRSFLKDVNNFYKSQNLCETYKLGILSCFEPAVEIELLSLLKLCLNIINVEDLYIVRCAVENSVLVQACQKNEKNIHKIVNILKRAFLLSEGNPVVGYLTFYLCKSIEQTSYNQSLLPKELSYLDTFFNFPYHLVTNSEQELLIKKLINSCFETTNMYLCTKKDLVFYTAVFPTCYHKMLNMSVEQTSNCIPEFLKYLCISDKFEFSNVMNDIRCAQENCIWKFMLPLS